MEILWQKISALIIAGALSVAGLFGYQDNNLGATVTLTNLSDTIGTFRTNVNDSLNSINAALSDSTSTNPGHLHTTSSISGVFGTSSGALGITATPTNGQLLSANTNTPAWKTLNGSGGTTITSTTDSITINTTALDTSASYNWTGGHSFAGGVTSTGTFIVTGTSTIATTTFTGRVTLASTTPTGDNEAVRKFYVDDLKIDLIPTTTHSYSITDSIVYHSTSSAGFVQASMLGGASGAQCVGYVSDASGTILAGTSTVADYAANAKAAINFFVPSGWYFEYICASAASNYAFSKFYSFYPIP
jgi:hypothetical protein